MKNIHVLPTDKPSRLRITSKDKLILSTIPVGSKGETQNIYITNDEEIKEGDWVYLEKYKNVLQFKLPSNKYFYKKIILTTDQDLIKDGVQAIDDEFLKWFVNNPSCEEVEVEGHIYKGQDETEYKIIIPKEEPKTAWVGVLHDKLNEYHPAEYELKDIYQGEGCLPNFPDEELCQIWCESKYKEEPKQETLEEAAERHVNINVAKYAPKLMYKEHFIAGAKWQQERSYSEEEVYNILQFLKLKLKIGVLKWQDDFEFDLDEWFNKFKK